MLNLPNVLTISRICLVPVLVVLLLQQDEAIAAAAVFSIGMLTDALDGRIARSRELITNFGKLMDPIADKLLVGAAFVCLALTDRVEPWVVAVILFREAMVTGLRLAAKRDGLVIAANTLGKAKTALQTVAVLVLVLAADPFAAWVQLIVSATLMITIASGMAYLVPYVAHRRAPVDDTVPARRVMAGAPVAQPSRAEWRLLTWIAIPSLALAFCLTVVSAYVPVILENFTDSGLAIGALISGEGLAALLVPVLVGAWSDGLQTRLGPRLPILLAATPICVGGLVMVAFGSSLAILVVALFLFYAAYFAYFGPYLALYPDLIRAEVQGRAQGANGVARQLGLGLGLVGGGALLAASQELPFIVAGVLLAVATIALAARLRKIAPNEKPRAVTEGRVLARAVDLLRRRPEIRGVVVVNALWELSVAAMKTFGILFAIVGLGLAPEQVPLSVGLIAIGVVVGAVIAGKLADRYGAYRLLRIVVWPYGLGLLAPFLSQNSQVLVIAMPLVAFGAGAVTTLAYVALVRAAPRDAHGAASGLFALSRGVGVLLGPLLAGIAVEALEPALMSTHGYAAAWLVAALAVLATVPVLGWLCRSEQPASGVVTAS